MILLVAYLCIALLVSFYCSIMEAVLLSLTPGYIEVMRKERPRAGRKIGRLKRDIERPLAAILTLNTIAHTLGAAGVGAEALHLWGEKWVVVVSVVLTLLILVFSEIVPKTLGATYWRALSGLAATTLPWIALAMAPFVALSTWLTRILARKKGPVPALC